MYVYPDISDMSNVFASLDTSDGKTFSKKWLADITRYTREIDKNLFNRTIISFNQQELTALLLHELAHVVFSSKKSERFYDAYRINKAQLKLQEKKATRIAQSVIYAIPGMIACGMHSWNVGGKSGRYEEYICDQMFGVDKYRENLEAAINKIVRAYGTTIIKNETEVTGKLDASVKWCNINITELSHRRVLLKNEIVNAAANTRSKSLKRGYLNIMARFGVGMRDKYTGNLIATESVFDEIESLDNPAYGLCQKYEIVDLFANEGLAFSSAIENTMALSPALESKKAPKLPSNYDIDAIAIEIDRIENHHDRSYVLDLIYNKIEQINEFKEYSEFTKTIDCYSATIKNQLDALNATRLSELNQKIIKSE